MASKELWAQRLKDGLCWQCGAERGEDGTSKMCRRCADMNNKRGTKCRDKRVNQGLCSACGEPRGQDGADRMCRPCIQRAVENKAANIQRRGTRPNVFICVNGVCTNCHRNTGTGREYEGCKRCYFRHLARLYLDTSRRWREIRDIWEKQGGRCPYTGMRLDFGVDASLDHIKPSSLYPELANDPDNLEFVHLDINRMKGDMEREEFLDFVHLIANNVGLLKEADDPYGLFKDQDQDQDQDED